MTTRIASGAGFWGDYPDATGRLLSTGEFDYLQLEYLAEVTMGLLARLRESGREGYATDFVDVVVADHLETLLDRDVSVVTNAGGIAPDACAKRVRELAAEQGRDPTVATVTGDDLTASLPELRDDAGLDHFETGESLPNDVDPLVAVAYVGAFPIAEALDRGADVVVTGRVADPALTLGPLIHEYGWDRDDFDELAAGSLAGHLIECGTQVTGGNFLGEWRDVSFEDIGYPIAEVAGDGSVTITKPPETGGIVTKETVSEQLVYEIGDPTAYLTPDVTVDVTSAQVREAGDDAVRIEDVTGTKPPSEYKATVHYPDGYKVAGQLLYSRPDALEKARRAADILERRIEELGLAVADTHADYVGHDAAHGPMAPERETYNEIMLRFAARGESRADLRRLGMEFAPLSMAGPPSVTGLTDGGRPSPTPVVGSWPTLVPREAVDPEVAIYA
jgi:hypothetical protein